MTSCSSLMWWVFRVMCGLVLLTCVGHLPAHAAGADDEQAQWLAWSRQRHHAAYRHPGRERQQLEAMHAQAVAEGRHSLAWRVLGRLAQLSDGASDSRKAQWLDRLEDAIVRAREAGDDWSLFELLNGRVFLRADASPEAAMLDVQAMFRIAEARDVPRMWAIAEQYMGVVLTYQNRTAEAQPHLEQARQLDDDVIFQAEIATFLSASLSQGKDDARSHQLALSILEQTLQRVSLDDYPGMALLLLQGVGVLQQRLGELDKAEQTLLRLLEIGQAIGEQRQAAAAVSALVQVRHRRGDHAGVLRLVDAVEPPAGGTQRLGFYRVAAMSAAALHDPRARAWLTQASLAHASIVGVPSQDEKYHDAAAVVLAALGDHRSAFEHARQAKSALVAKITASDEAQRAKFETAMHLAVKERENESLRAWQVAEQADRNALTLGLIALGLVLTTLTIAFWTQSRARRRLEQLGDALRLSNGRLEVANADLAALNASRTHLLSAACHDMRESTHTLGLLAEGPDDDEPSMRQRLKDIRRCSAVLSEMMGNLLDMARLEGDRYEPQCTDFRLDELLDDVRLQLRQLLIRFPGEVHLDGGTVHVFSDRHLLRRVLINLLSNALKYTREGCVCVCASQRGGWVHLCIEDTGPGMSADKVSKVFADYVRLEDTAQVDGLGIGLAIVKRACELLDIDVTLRSTPGVGTRFELRIPAGRTAAAPPQSLPEGGRGERVVLLDDDPIGRSALRLMMANAGYEVIAAGDADEALRALEGRRPQLIIADYRLAAGEADGATQAVRLNAATGGGRTPMLLVTGSVEPEVAEQAQAHGMRVVYKPAGRERLLRTVAQVLEAARPVAARPPPVSEAGEVAG